MSGYRAPRIFRPFVAVAVHSLRRRSVPAGAPGPWRRSGSTTGLLVALLLGTVLLVGCAARGVAVDPVRRSLGWFSYLGGEDVREGCFAGAAERLRFVYNAVYTEQIRTYDVLADPGDTAATVTARVFGSASLVGLRFGDLLAPWHGTVVSARIDRPDLKALRLSLDDSGFFRPAPEGLLLRSDGFYWAVSACLDGAFHFNAFAAPSEVDPIRWTAWRRLLGGIPW